MRDALRKSLLKHTEALQDEQTSVVIREMLWVFAIGNVVLGYGLWQIHDKSSLLIKAHLSLKLWSVVFAIIGVIMIYALVSRMRNFLQVSVAMALFVKAVIEAALIYAVIKGAPIAFPVIWTMLLLIQFIAFIHLRVRAKQNGTVTKRR